MWRMTILLVVVAMLLCGASVMRTQTAQQSQVLQHRLGLSNADLESLKQDRAVARSLKVGDRREIAAGGAIRVAVPIGFFLQRFVDIVSFKQSPLVRQIGKFRDKPRLEDLERLTFDQADLDELNSCRDGDCHIQLSRDQIRRIQATVDWSKPDARLHVNQVLRELLLEYVEAYKQRGNQALLEYANEKAPLKLGDELRLLVAHSDQTLAGVPEFSAALLNSPALVQRADEFIYWSKEQFGLKPVVSITHVLVYLPQRADVPDLVIASKQIFASRYFAGSLAITLGVDTSSPTASSFYMAYVNRSRPRAFPPVIGGLVRRVAQRETREGLEQQLQLTKARLEMAFRASSK